MNKFNCWILIFLATAQFAIAADDPKWEIPRSLLRFDMKIDNDDRKVVFLDKGMCVEVEHSFLFLKHNQIDIVGDVSLDGRFVIETGNEHDAIEIKSTTVKDGEARAELIRKNTIILAAETSAQARAKLKSTFPRALEQATNEQRNMKLAGLRQYLNRKREGLPDKAPEAAVRRKYVEVRFDELVAQAKPTLLELLNKIAGEHPARFNKREIAEWSTASGTTLRDEFNSLLRFDIIEAYVRGYGLTEFKSEISNFRNLLTAKFEAVNAVVTGSALEDPEEGPKVAKGLNITERKHMTELLTVKLRARFFPATHRTDGNSQWFNSQKINCTAYGANSIRVEGEIDPTKNDATDWWTLLSFDEDEIELVTPENADVIFDPLFEDENIAKLRVRAKNSQRATYWFELRPIKKSSGKIKIILNESPSTGTSRFPF